MQIAENKNNWGVEKRQMELSSKQTTYVPFHANTNIKIARKQKLIKILHFRT